MTAPSFESAEQEIERRVAVRTAELTELLGHITDCWDEERRVLARQMHDNLGSTLTALTMHLSLLHQQLPPDAGLQQRSAQMKQLLLTIIDNNREMQLALWNDKLEFLGIKAAIAEVVAAFGAKHQLDARVSLPEHEPAYPRSHGVALLRCLEEGLHNVADHARASALEVVLDDNDETIMLTIRDDGVGAPAGAGNDNGCHGLRLLRERALHLGGSVRLGQAQPHGLVLSMTLPQPGVQPSSAA